MQVEPGVTESAESAMDRSWNDGSTEDAVETPGVPELGPVVEVDAEFQKLIPLQSKDELKGLEDSLLKDGCRDALVVWKDKSILLDGHTRLALCKRLGIKYQIAEVECTDRAGAKEWIIRNQLGRRNLLPFQRAELVAHLKPYYAAQARDNLKTSTGGADPQPSQKSEKAAPLDTAKQMGALAGMSHDTWAKVVFLMERAPENVKVKLREGDTSINRAYLDLHHSTRDARKRKAAAPSKAQRKPKADRSSVPEHLQSRLSAIVAVVDGDVMGDAIEALLDYVEGDGKESWTRWVEGRRTQ